MSRGKLARAAVRPRIGAVTLGTQHEGERLAEIRDREESLVVVEEMKKALDEMGLGPDDESIDIAATHTLLQEAREFACNYPDVLSFDLVLRNDGELTIRDPAAEVAIALSGHSGRGWGLARGSALKGGSLPSPFKKRGKVVYPLPHLLRPPDLIISRFEMRGEVVYPGDEREIPDSACQVICNRKLTMTQGDFVVRWKVFLDNSPPCAGEIDLGPEIQSARTRGEAKT